MLIIVSVERVAARERINSEFRKNASVNNTDEIRKLIKFGEATNEYLRRAIVQAVPTERGNLRKSSLSIVFIVFTDLCLHFSVFLTGLRLRPENMQTTLPGDECDELAAELGLRTPDLSSKKKTPGEPSAAPKKSKKAKII